MTELIKPLNKYFDHTLLKPEATENDIAKLCQEAAEYDFYSVCVNSCWVELASEKLSGTDVKIASVVGFPLGAMSRKAKLFETECALDSGAAEIDMVMNVGRFKMKDFDYVSGEIRNLADLCHSRGAKLKVIIETCKLTEPEIYRASRISVESGADFVKTSTGFSDRGATSRHVAQMKRAAGETVGVKASGGIRTLKSVLEMIEAGADRIGASASVAIMEEYQAEQ